MCAVYLTFHLKSAFILNNAAVGDVYFLPCSESGMRDNFVYAKLDVFFLGDK